MVLEDVPAQKRCVTSPPRESGYERGVNTMSFDIEIVEEKATLLHHANL